MKPIILHGHERAITQIKYNTDGDLLLSCSKDPTPNIWYSITGERLGTFDGHNGAVWSIDINWDSTKVVTGAADNTARLWDPSNGKMLSAIETKTAVRSCSFSYSGKMVLYTTDKSLGKTCEINIIDLNQQLQNAQSTILNIPVPTSKVSSAIWGPLDQSIITGHENGDIIQWDIRTGKKMLLVQEHKDVINDLQYSKDELMFITASKDHTAKLFDVSTMKPLKVYKTERPVNSGAISPIADHVIVAGGQEAMDVTTTSARQGKFDARFFHLIFEEEFGRIKDHFGPINSVAFHPDGKSYSSGGEDGYVRTHTFDPAYFEFDFEY